MTGMPKKDKEQDLCVQMMKGLSGILVLILGATLVSTLALVVLEHWFI